MDEVALVVGLLSLRIELAKLLVLWLQFDGSFWNGAGSSGVGWRDKTGLSAIG